MQEDGLITRVSRYRDLECNAPDLLCNEEHYKNRADKLTKLYIDCETRLITEYFEEGREDCVKSMLLPLLACDCTSGSGTMAFWLSNWNTCMV